MKRDKVHIERITSADFDVFNASKEVLHSGTLQECQSFVTDHERGQDAKEHRLLASIYYWASVVSFTIGVGAQLGDLLGLQITICSFAVILMILSEGHNAKC